MKKFLRSFLVVLLIASLAIVVTGCGKKDNNAGEDNKAATQTQTSEGTNTNESNKSNGTTSATKSKTYNVVSKLKGNYIMTMEQVDGEEEGEITLAVKDGKVFMDATADGEKISIIYKDNITYMISHAEKAYMEASGNSVGDFSDMNLISEEDLNSIDSSEFKTGKETIEGVEYYYEEYSNDGTERYYFDGDELKYVKQVDGDEESMIKIIKLSSDVDDSLFEVPAGYTKVEY